MRAKTKGKHEIRKRFAIVIGVAAAGVMALGASGPAVAAADTKNPGTSLTTSNILKTKHETVKNTSLTTSGSAAGFVPGAGVLTTAIGDTRMGKNIRKPPAVRSGVPRFGNAR
jgi:hypothetical protein